MKLCSRREVMLVIIDVLLCCRASLDEIKKRHE